MGLKIEKAAELGFCFGVKRAIEILEKITRERGPVETLGAVVHNQQVLQRLADTGVTVADSVGAMKGDIVAIGAHGVSPKIEAEIRARHSEVINTTCPFVHRAQLAARRLAKSGFFVVIHGDANHPEVKGILGWADDRGIATPDEKFIAGMNPLPRRLGILSQTTQIPSHFTEFAKKLIDSALTKDAEIRIIDTVCHDIRARQQTTLKLANRVDLMLVIGSHGSANTSHLADLCSTVCQTHLVETAEDIQPAWLQGHRHIGVTSGASTAQETIDEVLARLEAMSSS
ncbi:MAG: 4-hydroxy-3-methylbut-2-enyl diphosphate reductase [Dehalococcoidales bacterium]|nr:4-hydroxy-3-methylbut-2-enyl diphosphate reductase [Dehalococcoidales bacterium]